MSAIPVATENFSPAYAVIRAQALAALRADDSYPDPETPALPIWLGQSAAPAEQADAMLLVRRLELAGLCPAAAVQQARRKLCQKEALTRHLGGTQARRGVIAVVGLAILVLGTSFAANPAVRPLSVTMLSVPAPMLHTPWQPGLRIPEAPPPELETTRGPLETGLASWYGPGFHGRTAADGTRYDQETMTAAHRSLPLGTRVVVRRTLPNGDVRLVVLKITDRGPYADTGRRVLDLSRKAAEMLGILQHGTAPVEIEVLFKPAKNQLHYRNGKPAGY